MKREYRDAAGSLNQHGVARLDSRVLEKGIPRGNARARQGGGLFDTEMSWEGNKPVRRQNRLFGQQADASAAQRRASFLFVWWPVHPVGHESRGDLISWFKARDARPSGGDFARSIGDREVGQLQFRIVRAPAHQQVAVIKGNGSDTDQDLARAWSWIGHFLAT